MSIYKILRVSAIYGLLYVTSCSQLTIHDMVVCAIVPGQSGAVCDGYLTNHQTILTQGEWMALSEGWLAISPDDWSNLKVELSDACEKLKCNYETQQAMAAAFVKMEVLKATAAELKGKK